MCQHISVLLNEVLNFLNPKDSKIYFDGTFGGGGYTKAILNAANCKMVACDRDEYVLPIANEMQTIFQDKFKQFV